MEPTLIATVQGTHKAFLGAFLMLLLSELAPILRFNINVNYQKLRQVLG